MARGSAPTTADSLGKLFTANGVAVVAMPLIGAFKAVTGQRNLTAETLRNPRWIMGEEKGQVGLRTVCHPPVIVIDNLFQPSRIDGFGLDK